MEGDVEKIVRGKKCKKKGANGVRAVFHFIFRVH